MINYTAQELSKMNVVTDKYLSDLLHDLRSQTFGFQGRLQADNVVMEQESFHIKDFKRKLQTLNDTPVAKYKEVHYVDYQFINPQRKLKLKRSGLLDNEVDFYDISKNYQVFDKNYMAFIDGELVDCINIIVRENGIEFTLNVDTYGVKDSGISHSKYKEWRAKNAKVDVLFFSNSFFNPLVVDRETLFANKDNLSKFNQSFIDSLSSDQSYLSFVKIFESGQRSNLTHHENSEELLKFFSEHNATYSTKRAFINIYGFKNLARSINIPAKQNLIQIPGFKMPIPPENIMVFMRTPHGYSFTSDVKIELKYPNFYEITNPTGMNLTLFVFYSESNIDFKNYIDPLKPYYDVMGNSEETFITAPDIVKNYSPAVLDFSLKEYLLDESIDPLYYKLQKLNDIASMEPEFLRQFYKDRHENVDGYYVNMARVDLESRIRKDTSKELGESYSNIVFEEDHYLLTLKDPYEQGGYDMSLFIDGIYHYSELIFVKGLYTYVYVPTSLINQDSIIEVERTRTHPLKEEQLMFSDISDTLYVNVDKGKLAIADFDFIDNTTNTVIPRDQFKFSTETSDVYNRDHYEVMDSNTVGITCLNPDLLNKPISVRYGRESSIIKFDATVPGESLLVTLNVGGVVENEKIRVFKNGRMLPPTLHTLSLNADNSTKVTVIMHHEVGDEMIIHHTPDDYSPILDLEKVPESGIINLIGLIGRPFDLGWYDIYVNGRKLTKFNVEYVSPYIIKLKNLKSLDNLLIVNRARPRDIITLSETNKSIIDVLWNEDPVFHQKLVEMDKNINPVEDDLVTESIYWYCNQLREFFLNELDTSMQIVYLNPDYMQISTEVREKYPLLFRGESMNMHVNPDIGSGLGETTTILHINPDSFNDTEYLEEIAGLYNRILTMGGIINPDQNQITDEMRSEFPLVLGEDRGLALNPDYVFNAGEKPYIINPDN